MTELLIVLGVIVVGFFMYKRTKKTDHRAEGPKTPGSPKSPYNNDGGGA